MPSPKEALTMLLPKEAAKDIILRLLAGENYRDVVIAMINADFLEVAMDFLRDVATAKMYNKKIDNDWYRENFIHDKLKSVNIATNAGTNLKTIKNATQTAAKKVVLDTSLESYSDTVGMINDLLTTFSKDSEININLKIRVGSVDVGLTLTETLIVINALAAKRATIRGGAWSTAGKRVEKPLMEALCRIFGVSDKHYHAVFKNTAQADGFQREVDFYLCPPNGKREKCEVKLMGRGNPESADAVIALGSRVFVGDKLSDTNKKQLDHLKVLWVELHSDDRFKRFQKILEALKVPHKPLSKGAPPSKQIERAINAALKIGESD